MSCFSWAYLLYFLIWQITEQPIFCTMYVTRYITKTKISQELFYFFYNFLLQPSTDTHFVFILITGFTVRTGGDAASATAAGTFSFFIF